MLAPATLTLITTNFREGAARARALGIWSAVAAAGATAGALLGGILTEALSWRWILFVNVPVGLATIVAARAFLPESRAEGMDRRHLDIAGAVTVTAGLVALVFAIVRTETYGWTSVQVLAPLGVAIALLGAFAFIEGRLARSPLVPFRIFRSRSLSGGNAFIMLFFAAMFGAWYFETLYMQSVLGFTPIQAGVAFLPQTLLIAIGSQVASRLIARFGTRNLMVVGSAIAATGLVWLSTITPHSTFVADLLGPFLLIGTGMGLSVTPVVVAGTSGVEPREAGLASGLLNTSRIVGAAVGLAALSTVAATRTASVLANGSSGPGRVAAAVTNGYSAGLVVGAVILRRRRGGGAVHRPAAPAGAPAAGRARAGAAGRTGARGRRHPAGRRGTGARERLT